MKKYIAIILNDRVEDKNFDPLLGAIWADDTRGVRSVVDTNRDYARVVLFDNQRDARNHAKSVIRILKQNDRAFGESIEYSYRILPVYPKGEVNADNHLSQHKS